MGESWARKCFVKVWTLASRSRHYLQKALRILELPKLAVFLGLLVAGVSSKQSLSGNFSFAAEGQ